MFGGRDGFTLTIDIVRNEKKEKNTFIFGIRAVIEAVTAGKELEKVFVQKGLTSELSHELQKTLRESNIPFQYVPAEKINKVAGYRNHQGVAAILSPVTYQHIENILPQLFEEGKTPLLLILDRITDVRNFGAICRSAECLGVHMVIIPSRGGAQVTPDAIKTSAGALHKIPVCRSENLKTTIAFLKESGLQIIACTEKAEKNSSSADLTLPSAVLLGSEEDGISEEYLRHADVQVKIPLLGEIGSLNVSVAAGIILYEAQRQRQGQ